MSSVSEHLSIIVQGIGPQGSGLQGSSLWERGLRGSGLWDLGGVLKEPNTSLLHLENGQLNLGKLVSGFGDRGI